MGKILCPGCGKKVKDKAENCPHCGYPVKMLDGFGAQRIMCRYCGEGNKEGAEVCWVCGKPLNAQPENDWTGTAYGETTRIDAAGTEANGTVSDWEKDRETVRRDDMSGGQPGEGEPTAGRISGAVIEPGTGGEYISMENGTAWKVGKRRKFSFSNIFTSRNLYLMAIGGIILFSVVSGMIEKANEKKSREALGNPLVGNQASVEAAVDVLDEESTSYMPDEEALSDMMEEYTVSVAYETAPILDENGIYVAMTGQEQTFEDGGLYFKAEIRNNTDREILVSGDSMAVNGIMLRPLLYETVAPESEVQVEFGVEEELRELNITEVADLRMSVSVWATDNYDEALAQADGAVIPVTAGEDYIQTYKEDGEVLYNQGGVKIMLAGQAEILSLSLALPLYIENNTNRDLSIWEDSITVNGVPVDGYIGCRIYPGCKGYTDLKIYTDTLEEAGIDKAEYGEVSFDLWDTHTGEDISKTAAVRIDFETAE